MSEDDKDNWARMIGSRATENTGVLFAAGGGAALARSARRGRVAPAPPNPPVVPAKRLSPARQPTKDVFLLYYFEFRDKGEDAYTLQKLTEYIEYQEADPSPQNSRFLKRKMRLVVMTNPNTLKSDMTVALQTPGAVIVFIGHARVDVRRKKTYGLVTRLGRPKVALTNADLAYLVARAKAKALFIGGCSSDGCLSRTRGEMFTVLTHSGANQVTGSLAISAATHELFDRLFDTPPATLHQAMLAANVRFRSPDDYFVAIGGDGSMTLDASPRRSAP
jgi:hypothetical protein